MKVSVYVTWSYKGASPTPLGDVPDDETALKSVWGAVLAALLNPVQHETQIIDWERHHFFSVTMVSDIPTGTCTRYIYRFEKSDPMSEEHDPTLEMLMTMIRSLWGQWPELFTESVRDRFIEYASTF